MDILKSLTPEAFNALIVAALGLSLVLGGWRFYKDLKRPPTPKNADELYLSDMRRFYDQASKQETPRS
jgi:hypothetical protein